MSRSASAGETATEALTVRYTDLERHAEYISNLASQAPSPKDGWAARLSTNHRGEVWSPVQERQGKSRKDLRDTNPYLPLIVDEFLSHDPEGGRLRLNLERVEGYTNQGWRVLVRFDHPQPDDNISSQEQKPVGWVPEALVDYYEELRSQAPGEEHHETGDAPMVSEGSQTFCPSCQSTSWDGSSCEVCGHGLPGQGRTR